MSDDTTAPGTAAAPFRVLCVCEGNICRSPVAQLLLQAALGAGAAVASAGTGAVVGAPVAPPMLALLADRGIDGHAFRARQLERGMVEAADLVLVMTARQRAQAVALAPAAVRRTFTLRELARLLAEVDPAALPAGTVGERLRAALPLAAARRRYRRDPREDDVADPYGRSDTAYRRAFAAIEDAVGRIGADLGAAPDDQSIAGSASRVSGEQKDTGGTTDRAAASASS